MPAKVYILTAKDKNGTLKANLGVFSNLKSAISFIITQRMGQRNTYFSGGILKFQTPDAIDAWGLEDLGDHVYLYGNIFYDVVAERMVLY